MNQQQAEELSALLDGELNGARAAQLRAEIAGDPSLRALYAELAHIDADLRELAEDTSFVPEITWPTTERASGAQWRWPSIAAAAFSLMLVRFLPKLLDLSVVAVAINLLAAAAVCTLIVKWAQEQQGAGRAGS